MRTARIGIAILCALAMPARADTIDGVAAIVGDKVILRSQLDLAAELAMARAQAQGASLSGEQQRELRMQALRGLIDDELIMGLAERNEAVATDEDLDAAIASIAREEGVEVEYVYRAAASQGMDRNAYREQLRREITRMRVVDGTVRQRIAISDQQVRELFEKRYADVKPGERLRVLHILIPVPPETTDAQRQQLEQFAQEVRDRALETGDFAGLARRVSAAPSAPQGGLTMFRQGDAPAAIEAALQGLVAGEITPIIRSEHGLNLFQFLDRFDPASVTFEDVEPQLRVELAERETGPEFERFLAEVRKSRYIEIVNPNPR